MKQIIGSLLYLAALLSLSVFVFDPTHLYYELPWLDIPMHVMGGFGVASFFLALASFKSTGISLVRVLVLYSVVAISWELYEIVKDSVLGSSLNGLSDTFSDFVNGALGALGAFYLLKK